MKFLADKIQKSAKIFWLFSRANLLRGMEYRFDFITGLIPTGIYTASYFIFIGVIFSQVPSINGWSLKSMLLLFAVEQAFFYASWLFFRTSLEDFPDSIRDGTFDFNLRLPANTRLLSSFKEQVPDMVPSLIFPVFLFFYVISGTPLEIANIILFLILLVCGIVILYNILFTFAAFSFWIIESDKLVSLAGELAQISRYPDTVFPTILRWFLMTAFPVLLMVFVPVSALLGKLDWEFGTLTLLVTIISFFISEKIWQAGLRHYSSASS